MGKTEVLVDNPESVPCQMRKARYDSHAPKPAWSGGSEHLGEGQGEIRSLVPSCLRPSRSSSCGERAVARVELPARRSALRVHHAGSLRGDCEREGRRTMEGIKKVAVWMCAGALLATAAAVEAEVTALNWWGGRGGGNGTFNYPSGLAIGAGGTLYVSDSENNLVQHFSPEGQFLQQWRWHFDYPQGLAVNEAGQVYVADRWYHRVAKFSADGAFLRTWGSSGSGNGQFRYPMGIAVGGSGDIYVSDNNDRVQRFTANGTYVFKWGSSGSGPGKLNQPQGLAFSPGGTRVFVADRYNHRIQRFTRSGTLTVKWGGQGNGQGKFDNPGDVAVNALGDVYVTDEYNHRVQKFGSNGTYIGEWGTPGTGLGQFKNPYGIDVAETGMVYVTEYSGHRIQRFFDSDAWASGFNDFTDSNLGPTAVGIGTGQLLGRKLTLTADKELHAGDLTVHPDGVLEMVISGPSRGTGYSQLQVQNTISAGGLFRVSLDVFVPGNGDDFDLLQYGSINGNFDFDLPELPGHLQWDASDLHVSGVLLVVPEPAAMSLLAVGGLACLRRKNRAVSSPTHVSKQQNCRARAAARRVPPYIQPTAHAKSTFLSVTLRRYVAPVVVPVMMATTVAATTSGCANVGEKRLGEVLGILGKVGGECMGAATTGVHILQAATSGMSGPGIAGGDPNQADPNYVPDPNRLIGPYTPPEPRIRKDEAGRYILEPAQSYK